MTGLVKDYYQYKNTHNVTFIGICTSTVATLDSMQKQVETYGLKPFANMLDSGGATAAAYGVSKTSAFRLVVIDGDSKIAYNASRGWHWSSGPDAGKYIHQTQLEKSLKQFPGILKIKEADIPDSMKYAAHLYDLQQFGLLEEEIQKAVAKDKSGLAESFAMIMRDRVADHRKGRLQQIQDLSKADPVQAYREAIAFVAAFPKAPEMAEVRSIGSKLMNDAKVKKELNAEAGYQRLMVPEMRKATTMKQFKTKVLPLLDGYLKVYGDTEFSKTVQAAVEGNRQALSSY